VLTLRTVKIDPRFGAISLAFLSCICAFARSDTESDSRSVIDQAPSRPGRLTGSVGPLDGPKQVIHGQCFIVTEGGVNIKLALVSIRIISADLLDNMEKDIMKRFTPRLDYWQKLAKEASDNKNYDLARVYLNFAGDELLRLPDLLPPGPHGKTDADGKFELVHTMRPPFVVVAYASRRVGDDVERYEWRVPSSQIDEDGSLMLSNDNLRH